MQRAGYCAPSRWLARSASLLTKRPVMFFANWRLLRTAAGVAMGDFGMKVHNLLHGANAMKTVCLLSAGCGIVLFAVVAHARAMDDRAATILHKSAQNTKVRQAPQAKDRFDDSIIFTYANGRLLSEVRLTDRKTGEKLHLFSLFDGRRYHMFNETAGQLVVSNSPTTPGTTLSYTPIESPFMFLSQEVPACFDKLRNSSTWSDISRNATYLGTELVDNHLCEKVRVPVAGPNDLKAQWTVYFAPDVNYYPIKSEATVNDGEPRGGVAVRAYEVEHMPDGDCVVPTDVVLVEYSKTTPGEVAEEVELLVQSGSLKVNADFDDDLFTIAASRAEWFHDVDAQTHIHVGGKNASFSQDSRGAWRAVVASLVMAVVVAGVAWGLWKRRG